MGTLSKALGGFGGFIAGGKKLIEYLINMARPLIYTTALPPSVLAAGLAAVQIIQKDPERRARLWQNTTYFRNSVSELGFDTMGSETPIVPLRIGSSEKALIFSQKLMDAGLYVPAIRPPTVPNGTDRLRISLMATHTQEEMDTLLLWLEKIGQALKVI